VVVKETGKTGFISGRDFVSNTGVLNAKKSDDFDDFA
jgi:hypothetical protein